MGVQWLIGEAIGLIVTAIDNYIHRVEYAREKTEELLDQFNKEQDTLKEHKKLVEDLSDRYSELAKGVDENTNANLTLSTDEYKEYLDINDKLSKAFPTLNQGIDANGNSILKIGSNALQSKAELVFKFPMQLILSQNETSKAAITKTSSVQGFTRRQK